MRALIMAGGTGGHVFPALAVAQELQTRGWQVAWLGSAQGMENQLVPAAGITLHRLQVRGVRGGSLPRRLAAPFMLLRAVWQALQILRRFQPDVVLGFGGFAAGPGGIAAWLARRPLIIHEQNAVAGMTNRGLARVARVCFQAFPGALPDAQVVGNPVRPAIFLLTAPALRYTERSGALHVLVLGGSQGAVALNEQLPACLAEVFRDEPITVRHQCGRGRQAATRSCYAKTELNVEVMEFIDDMAAAYGWADFVICRAGALTVSEIAAAGVPAVFIPFPAAVDDHQTRNAEFLVQAGAARLLPQATLSSVSLKQALTGMHERKSLQLMARKAQTLAVADSVKRVADACEETRNG